MAVESIETVAGIVVPDSALVREAPSSSATPKTTCCSTIPGGYSCSARCMAGAADCNPTWNCSTSERCSTTSG